MTLKDANEQRLKSFRNIHNPVPHPVERSDTRLFVAVVLAVSGGTFWAVVSLFHWVKAHIFGG